SHGRRSSPCLRHPPSFQPLPSSSAIVPAPSFISLGPNLYLHTPTSMKTLDPSKIAAIPHSQFWSLSSQRKTSTYGVPNRAVPCGDCHVWVEIRPWTHMMEVPQLHGFGPAASRLLEAYKMLLKFLRNLRNLRDSHGALAFGYSETSEGPSSVTKIISECESALTDLNRGLRILSTSIARQQGEKMST
ncbi:nuclear matrix protein, partial [Trifolium pratense]